MTKSRFAANLLVIFLFNLALIFPLHGQVAFYKVDLENALNDTYINFINQDSTGHIWLSGTNKMFRFDGVRYKKYESVLDSVTLKLRSFFNINNLFTDSRGQVYVGSNSGLSSYNSHDDIFVLTNNDLSGVRILDIDEDENGLLWLATQTGLAQYNPLTGKTIWFTGTLQNSNVGDKIANADFVHVDCQPGGHIWVSNFSNEIFRFNAANGDFENLSDLTGHSFQHKNISELRFKAGSLFVSTTTNGFFEINLKSKEINNQYFDHTGYDINHFQFENDTIIWLTGNNGLFRYNRNLKTNRRFTNVPNDPLSLERTAQKYVFIDRNANIWVSSGIRGVNFGLNRVNIQHLTVSDGNGSYQLFQKEVTSIDFDRNGNLWLGYESGRIEKHTPDPDVKHIYFPEKHNEYIQTGSILALKADSKNNIWAGGWNVGLQKFNHVKNAFEHAKVLPESLGDIFLNADIRGFMEDRYGNIWMSVHGKGIAKYNPDTHFAEIFSHKPENPTSGLSNNWAYNLCPDSENNIWVATAHGVTRLNPATKKITSFFHDEDYPESLSDNSINTVHCDKDGNVWAGTISGLNVFNPVTQAFQKIKFPSESGIQNIAAIASTQPGEIWCSTQSGIFRLNYRWDKNHEKLNHTVHFFNRTDGFINSSYFTNSAAANSESMLYWCGDEGIDFFNPKGIYIHGIQKKDIIYSEIRVDGKPAKSAADPKNAGLNMVMLQPSAIMVDIRFSALSFNNSKLKYRYKLEGFNKEWVYPENETVATYTSLPAGEYSFKVGVFCKNGEWTDSDTLLKIKVIPPFWATLPFILISVFLIVAMFLLILYLRSSIQKNRQIELEKIIELRTSEIVSKNIELENSNQTKNKFLSIISHDLRGPVSGLMGILELMQDGNLPEEKMKEFISAANSSVKSTFNLLDNLLLWARSQTDKIEFYPSIFDLGEIMNSCVDLKMEQARQKNILIKRKFGDSLVVQGDMNMIDTVFRNILNNAIKFTYPGGKVTISTSQSETEVMVSVADTGIGLTPEQTETLFDLKTTGSAGTSGEPGTGLGLIICNEFIQKNKGRLWVTPNEPQGAIFHFSLPKA